MAVPNLPCVFDVFAHHDCTHNQLVSIHNRVCGLTPQPKAESINRLRDYTRRLGASLRRVGPWALDRVVEHYTGSKRVRYQRAAEKYRSLGLTQRQAEVSMFIKCEKIKFSEAKPNPDPRAIQFRDPVYSVVLASYLKPVEEVVYNMRGNRLNGLPRTRVIAKGLNQRQRASLLEEKLASFVDPLVFGLDASRFDQHVSVGHLEAEHALYREVNNDPDFARLLSWQLRNVVRTSKGVKYVTRGKRMSGDMNTALGNCVIMVSMLGLFFEGTGIGWDCLDDGDDILLIIERSSSSGIEALLEAHFLDLGMTLKVESKAEIIEEVEFCQSHPVWVDGHYTFVRNPAKVMSGALVGHKWISMPSLLSRRKLCNTIGMCEAILNRGVPVLQEFAQALIRNAATQKQVRLEHAEQLFYRVRNELGKSKVTKLPVCKPLPISDEARQSFQLAFGVSVDEQLHWEAYLRGWQFSLEGGHDERTPVDVDNWLWESWHDERYH